MHIIAGSRDPLTYPVSAPTTVIDGAGHYPHLTHPEQLTEVLDSVRNQLPRDAVTPGRQTIRHSARA
ncbi:hypothetical protein [Nocardia sp. NPDC019395]|uniref:alpha/beta fold hydrolase n=1 Tax=Nocardia sp. NPDC019395 TaxID=3154686 RepID=UPI0033F5CF5E